MADKSDHDFVPTHEILGSKETKEVLERLRIKAENLPKILAADPQAKKLGAKPGQVLRIKRNDYGNAYTYYRLVEEI